MLDGLRQRSAAENGREILDWREKLDRREKREAKIFIKRSKMLIRRKFEEKKRGNSVILYASARNIKMEEDTV